MTATVISIIAVIFLIISSLIIYIDIRLRKLEKKISDKKHNKNEK